jgi:hypothetical protein
MLKNATRDRHVERSEKSLFTRSLQKERFLVAALVEMTGSRISPDVDVLRSEDPTKEHMLLKNKWG